MAYKFDDKDKHFIAGALIALICGGIIFIITDLFFISCLLGFLIAAVTGVLKEVVWDGWLKKGTVNNMDALVTIAGAASGTGVLAIILGVILSH